MAATEDKIFAVLKTWLLAGKDKTIFGQMEIRRRIVNPRQASSMADYSKAVTEWDADIDKLKAYAGPDALPVQSSSPACRVTAESDSLRIERWQPAQPSH